VRRIPELLVQLVAAQNPHQVVTRLITDIGDATTRRLLALAEAKLGPPPVPYLWLACGSQGRQEQTGVSDQDNCLILDDAATPPTTPISRNWRNSSPTGWTRRGISTAPAT
jgi:CBS domain-containing protein